VNQQELGKDLRPYQYPPGNNDDKSVTLDELALKAIDLGFTVYHRPAGTIELIRQIVSQDIPVITRTWLHKGEDIGHYRVITGYDDATNEIIQDDSYQGAGLRFTYTDFLELWQAFNYEFLLIVPKQKQQSVELKLGSLKDSQEAWKQALLLAEQELNKNPDNIYSQFNQSVALYKNNQYQESVNVFEHIEHRLPDRMLWYQLEPIYAYYFLGDYDRVFEVTQEILEGGNRGNAELYYLLALIYNKQANQAMADKNVKWANTYNSSTYWKKSIEEELVK
jgi:tetratricopeptide (TPR) repeat protein